MSPATTASPLTTKSFAERAMATSSYTPPHADKENSVPRGSSSWVAGSSTGRSFGRMSFGSEAHFSPFRNLTSELGQSSIQTPESSKVGVLLQLPSPFCPYTPCLSLSAPFLLPQAPLVYLVDSPPVTDTCTSSHLPVMASAYPCKSKHLPGNLSPHLGFDSSPMKHH